MKYLKIANKGKIEIEAFTLMGASTKRGDSSKIGMFGSGNKYAIAYFLRNNYQVICYSGLDRIEFTSQKKEFRDQQYDVLCINGNETSITLQMGYNWKLWQAVRELYSNSLDEGLVDFSLTENPENYNHDESVIYISACEKLEYLYFNHDSYFIDETRKPIFTCNYGSIYPKTGTTARIYRKRIRVFETKKNALFDYDLPNINIGENRLALYSWEPTEHIWNILYSCDKKEVIRKILNEINNTSLIEREINEGIITPNDSLMSTQWIEALENRQVFSDSFAGWLNEEEKVKTDFVPNALYHVLTSKIGDSVKPKNMSFSESGNPYVNAIINDVRAETLSKATDFLHDAKFKMDYKIKVVDFKNKDILASIDKDNQIILLDIQSLDKGHEATVNAIIEEYVHLKYGVADETRGFQDAIITELICYMKNRIGDLQNPN